MSFINSEWGDPGKLRFHYAIHKTDYYNVYSDENFWNSNVWYHVVINLDSEEGMIMYIDNIKQESTGEYFNSTESSSLSTFIGSWGYEPNRNFLGVIDDVIFYNRVLSEKEIEDLYIIE